MASVEYTGLKTFTDAQQASIQTLAERYANKFEKYYPDSITRIILKTSRNSGNKQQTSVTVRLDAPKTIARAQGMEWEPSKAVHSTLIALHTEIEKMVKTQQKTIRKVRNKQ